MFFLFPAGHGALFQKRDSLFRPSRRDAAALACSFKAAKAAYAQSKWPRTVRICRNGTVREPASGAFDVTVAPGEGVQASVDACPPGGCVLLLPGTHEGPLVLAADKVVHVFGRGQATLRAGSTSPVPPLTSFPTERAVSGPMAPAVTCFADEATLDGLVIRQVTDVIGGGCGVSIRGGRLRLHACDISSKQYACVSIEGNADPTVTSCRCVLSVLAATRLRLFFSLPFRFLFTALV